MSGDNYNSNSVDATLSRIESNQGTMMATMKNLEGAFADQNRRLMMLENSENKRMGALAALGIVCSFVGVVVGLAVSYFKK